MESKIPERLDENGNLRQEYIDFMKVDIEHPELMSDDEILEWFISRRGGDKETIRRKIGEYEFDSWIKCWKSKKDFTCDDIGGPLKYFNWYIKEQNKQHEDWDKEKILEVLSWHNYFGYKTKEGILNSIYNFLCNIFIDGFRCMNIESWEGNALIITEQGMDNDEDIQMARDLKDDKYEDASTWLNAKTSIYDEYVIGGRTGRFASLFRGI